jgi:hypothetical protein
VIRPSSLEATTLAPEKGNVQPGDEFEDTAFKPGVKKFQILNQIVECRVFTSMWNMYHQRLPDIELIQISASFSFLSQDL